MYLNRETFGAKGFICKSILDRSYIFQSPPIFYLAGFLCAGLLSSLIFLDTQLSLYSYICEMQQSDYTFSEGKVLLFDKPLRWTSFDLVRKVRNLIKIKKVGHAGTLDPLATGLLIVCTGKFTKKINEYMGMEKEYIGTFTLGSTTPTFDLESEPQDFISLENITEQQILNATKNFIGDILQMPPQHSAIKKDGKRLYESARQGIEVKVDARPVTIKEFNITNVELPLVHFKVVCTTGTYIRSLANDFGALLHVGAHLSSLCRSRIGTFELNDAISITAFEEEIKQLQQKKNL